MRGRCIVHVDMDAFYASVEQRDDPTLRGVPVIVGGRSPRSVVTTASYEARPYGVHSAMPMMEARRRCPIARVIPPNFEKYSAASRAVFAVFRRYTPLVEGLSLDEAFLDVTESRALFGDGRAIAARIKADIAAELSLTASAGVASTKFVAKIASDLEKPDGLVVIEDADVTSFLAALPIERMWGMGPKSAALARTRGFRTLGDLARASEARLEGVFGQSGVMMGRLARGDDPRRVEAERKSLSIGSEQTFDVDLEGHAALEHALLAESQRVAQRLSGEGLAAGALTVKLKYADFVIRTRSQALTEPIADTDSIFRVAKRLLARFEDRARGVRLVGVSASKLAPLGEITALFRDERLERGERLERAQAALRAKYGSASVTRAALLDEERRMGLGEARDHRDRD